MSAIGSIVIMANTDKIDLAGGWDRLWTSISGGEGIAQIANLATVVGVIIVVAAIVKWAWEKRRSGGGGGGGGGGGRPDGILWALLVGAILAGPNLILPMFLTVLDTLANAVINLWNSTGS